MKTSLSSKSRWPLAGVALALTVFTPALFAEEPATEAAQAGAKAADRTAEKLQSYKTDHSEMSKAEVKSALAQVDTELDRLDKIAESASTPQQMAEIRTHYDVLKERRKELGREFTRARYDAFKVDLQTEMDKVSAWAKETFTSKPAANSAANAANASAEATSQKIADYKTEATDVNKAEVRASLARLDADLERLSVRIDALNDPARKAELKHRLDAYKERRTELGGQFRAARYDALMADVKAEWNQLIN